jgi:glyoxylase I family protein
MSALVYAVHHVSLLVSDVGRSLAFYQGLLGLELDPCRPDLGYPGAWLKLGEQQLHLLQLPSPDPSEGRPAHGGQDRHLALLVSDLDALQAALSQAGVAFTRSRSGRRALFCRDPDQNALELVQAVS